MVMTLLGYRAVMAELHIDNLPREARTARKVRIVRHKKGA
jgi:plasmid stability protein